MLVIIITVYTSSQNVSHSHGMQPTIDFTKNTAYKPTA